MRNRAKPEGSIAEAYIIDECLTFCSRYFDDVETRFNRQGRQNSCRDDVIPQDTLSVFTHSVKLLGGGKVSYNDSDFDKLVWFVLNNCEEIDQYKMYVSFLVSFRFVPFFCSLPGLSSASYFAPFFMLPVFFQAV